MILSVRELWVGFDKSVDGMVVMIANKGTPTEQCWVLGPWCAIDGGTALSKRGSVLLRKQFFADALPAQVDEGPERPIEIGTETQRFNS